VKDFYHQKIVEIFKINKNQYKNFNNICKSNQANLMKQTKLNQNKIYHNQNNLNNFLVKIIPKNIKDQ
jgi:hypothetical protein